MKTIAVLQDIGYTMFPKSSYIIFKEKRLIMQEGTYTMDYPCPIQGGFIYDMNEVKDILSNLKGTFISLAIDGYDNDTKTIPDPSQAKLYLVYASVKKFELKSRYYVNSDEIVKLSGGRSAKTVASETYKMGEMTAIKIEDKWTFILQGEEVSYEKGSEWILNTYKINDLKFLSRKVEPDIRQKSVSGPKVEVKSQIVHLHKCGKQFAIGRILDIGGISRGYIMLWSDSTGKYHKIQQRETNAQKISYISGIPYDKRHDIDTNFSKLEFNDGEIMNAEFPSVNLCINEKLQFELVKGSNKLMLDVFGIGGQIKFFEKENNEWIKKNVNDIRINSFLIDCDWPIAYDKTQLDNVLSFFGSKGFLY